MPDIAKSWPPRENIILIGFMGSGKSTVGRMLSRKLRFQFLDTDQLIEDRTRMKIADMFAKHGEDYFRQRETATLESLAGARRYIISTGGGIVTRDENVPILRKLGWVVLLTADPDELYARVARSTDRPLLATENPRGKVHELLAARLPAYEAAAQFTVNSTGLTREAVVEAVIAGARQVFGWA